LSEEQPGKVIPWLPHCPKTIEKKKKVFGNFGQGVRRGWMTWDFKRENLIRSLPGCCVNIVKCIRHANGVYTAEG
jgi:hypothetical protein